MSGRLNVVAVRKSRRFISIVSMLKLTELGAESESYNGRFRDFVLSVIQATVIFMISRNGVVEWRCLAGLVSRVCYGVGEQKTY